MAETNYPFSFGNQTHQRLDKNFVSHFWNWLNGLVSYPSHSKTIEGNLSMYEGSSAIHVGICSVSPVDHRVCNSDKNVP
jgi:hypothetical protein